MSNDKSQQAGNQKDPVLRFLESQGKKSCTIGEIATGCGISEEEVQSRLSWLTSFRHVGLDRDDPQETRYWATGY